jgi:hypothetical protein
LEWVTEDSAIVKFTDKDDVKAKEEKLREVITKWIDATNKQFVMQLKGPQMQGPYLLYTLTTIVYEHSHTKRGIWQMIAILLLFYF